MAETHTRGVTLIVYRGEIVASAGARRSYLAPQIATLDAGEPLRQFVSLMAAFALLVRDGSNEGPYTDEAAERSRDSPSSTTNSSACSTPMASKTR